MRHEGFALTLSQGDLFPNSPMSPPPAGHAFPRHPGMAPAGQSEPFRRGSGTTGVRRTNVSGPEIPASQASMRRGPSGN
jgi:hypothetical protein